jgi:hypothetical protein
MYKFVFYQDNITIHLRHALLSSDVRKIIQPIHLVWARSHQWLLYFTYMTNFVQILEYSALHDINTYTLSICLPIEQETPYSGIIHLCGTVVPLVWYIRSNIEQSYNSSILLQYRRYALVYPVSTEVPAWTRTGPTSARVHWDSRETIVTQVCNYSNALS